MLIFFFINIILCLLSVVFSNEWLFMNSYILFTIQFVLGLCIMFSSSREWKLYMFFTPSFCSFIYLGLNFCLGAYFIPREYGTSQFYYISNSNVTSWSTILCVLLISNALVFHRFMNTSSMCKIYENIKIEPIQIPDKLVVFCIVLLLSFAFLGINLSFLGASDGDFSYPYKFILTIVLILYLVKKPIHIRFFIYVLIIAYFLVTNYNSKRQVFYIIICIVFIESYYKQILVTLSFKSFLLLFVALFMFLFIILFSSILRGYGNYDAHTFMDAIVLIPEYINEPFFKDAIIDNLEISTVFGNSSLCIEYVINNKLPIQYGETFLKVLYTPFPKEIVGRPNNMIDLYTGIAQPSFRQAGGSLPVITYSELFANFYYLFAPACFFLYKIFDDMFVVLIKQLHYSIFSFRILSFIFLISTSIQFIRGSGLDMYLVYYIITIPLIFILMSLYNFLSGQKH